MTHQPAVIRVAVPVPVPGGFDYLWSGPGAPPRPGCRVRVPLGKGERIGIVLDHVSQSQVDPARLKEALEALDSTPVLGPDLLEALLWCADYYHHPIGEIVSQALPTLLRRGRSPHTEPAPGWRLTDEGRSQTIALIAHRAPRQGQALDVLASGDVVTAHALRVLGIGADTLKRLADKGWIQAATRAERAARPTPNDTDGTEPEPELTEDQRSVLRSIADAPAGYQPFLLQGVTGSGKTEVYLRLIGQQLEAGRQSLLLVPEIGLTPQLVARLKRRFGDRLALMHSGLNDRERLGAWRDAYSGEAKLIVGTRSAVFAPLPSPGLIIVDEEHDPSYKQQEGFRYSARDLAIFRARQLDVPVLLASATPSLESFYNAQQRRYQSLTMPQRIGSAGTPAIRVVDLNLHAARHGLSTPLITAIERHLADDNQVLLFLNRRGFAPVLFCAECRTAEECGRCDARLTIHAASGQLRCHHCGEQKVLAWACADCGGERIAVGAGTQRVTEELAALFPTTRIARLDRDIASRKGALADVLADVEHGDTQILVGTQMLTKGHDFPRVTLVGVLSADQGLLGTDFRSNERLAQTLLQVAGRAGRREQPGEVLVQTHYPSHPLLSRLIQQDYTAFAELALAERQQTHWPPFSHLVVWRAQADARAPAIEFLRRVAGRARREAGPVKTLGPAPAAIERRGGKHRAQLLFQCSQRAPLHDLVRELLRMARTWPETRRVRWSIDVDPTEL
ncbi:MAG: primosomal protein N' [Gammaproteobacteria bacterium]